MVRSEEISRVSRYLKQKDLNYQVVIEDLQKAIDEENPSLSEQEMEELQGRKGLHQRYFIDHRNSIAFLLPDTSSFSSHLPENHRHLLATATLLRSISLIRIAIQLRFACYFICSTDTNDDVWRLTHLKSYRAFESRGEESQERHSYIVIGIFESDFDKCILSTIYYRFWFVLNNRVKSWFD